MATATASAIAKFFEMLVRFSRVSNAQFACDINTEYGVNASTEELQVLATARANGDLSQFVYLAARKRRGVLRNDFNQEDNVDRLATD